MENLISSQLCDKALATYLLPYNTKTNSSNKKYFWVTATYVQIHNRNHAFYSLRPLNSHHKQATNTQAQVANDNI